MCISFIYNGLSCSVDFSQQDGIDAGLVHFEVTANTGKAPFSYDWDFDNGFTCSGEVTDFTFQISGNYNVCLTQTDAYGCVITSCQEVVVNIQACPEYILETGIDFAGNLYGIVYNSENPDEAPSEVNWNIDGLEQPLEPLPFFYITSPASGDYTVCVEYTDIQDYYSNCSGTLCQPVHVISDTDDCSTQECVFPGDTNGDEVANIYDIFPIGVHYGQLGPERPFSALDWWAQLAQDWAFTDFYGINLKHVDCNGDGVIDFNDLEAIELNYQNDHAQITTGSFGHAPNVSLEYNSDSLIIIEDEPGYINISLDIILGEIDVPFEDIYAFATALEFDDDIVLPGSVYIEYDQECFIGEKDNLLKISRETSDGYFDFGFSKMNGLSVNGNGRVATVNFTIIEDLVIQKSMANDEVPMNIKFSGTRAIDNEGKNLPLIVQNIELIFYLERSSSIRYQSLENQITLSPNPSNGLLNIDVDDLDLESLNVLDAQGKMVLSYPNIGKFNQINKIDLSHLSNGIYFVQLQFQDTYITKKIILDK